MKKEMSMDEFKNLARRIYPLLTEMQEIASGAGIEGFDVRVDADGYMTMTTVGDRSWTFSKVSGYDPDIEYKYTERFPVDMEAQA